MRRTAQRNELSVSVIPLDLFTWDKERRVLVAEASDLHGRGHNWLKQIWNDSCDAGFKIRSHHTDRVETFHFAEEVRCGEDVGFWRFLPLDQSMRLSVEILND